MFSKTELGWFCFPDHESLQKLLNIETHWWLCDVPKARLLLSYSFLQEILTFDDPPKLPRTVPLLLGSNKHTRNRESLSHVTTLHYGSLR